MTTDTKKVTSAKPKTGGAVSVSPLGTVLPTDAKSPLDEAFESLGYISSDGLKNANATDVDVVKAWGNDTVLESEKDKNDYFTFTLIEALNVNVLKNVYVDENVSGTLETGITVKANDREHISKSWVIDVILKGGILKRTVIPIGKIIKTTEITYKDNSPIGYEVTVSAEKDTEGNSHYEYIVSNQK